MRYRAFADELRLRLGAIDLNGYTLTFGLPMPKSWTKKKKAQMLGKPHTQKPDIDNLLKALLDAVYADDSCVHTLSGVKKVWTDTGFILFEVK